MDVVCCSPFHMFDKRVDPRVAGIFHQKQRVMVPGYHARYLNSSNLRSHAP